MVEKERIGKGKGVEGEERGDRGRFAEAKLQEEEEGPGEQQIWGGKETGPP